MTAGSSVTRTPDGKLIRQYRDNKHPSQIGLAHRANVGLRTLQRIEQGKPATLGVLSLIAAVLQRDVQDLLVPTEVTAIERTAVREWNLDRGQAIANWQSLPNGLTFELYEVPSGTLPDRRKARGKRYNLKHLTEDQRKDCREWLRRHADTCEQIRSPHIARNLLSEPAAIGDYWWVIDEWIEGRSLADLIKADRSSLDVPRVAREMLMGLNLLHEKGIIRRGLMPNTIMQRPDGTIVLTDFEVAKLLEARPTVRPSDGFPDLPYLAPEVVQSGRGISEAADLFSWAVIVTEMLQGVAPDKRFPTFPLLDGLRAPKKIHDLLQKCLALRPQDRDRSVTPVLSVLSSWTR